MPVLLLAAFAMTAPDRPSAICQAIELPMPASGSAELGPAAKHLLDRFFRASAVGMAWPRHALGDTQVRFLIVAPSDGISGPTRNERLTRARGEAIRLHILRYRHRWDLNPGRLQIVSLRDSRLFLERAGLGHAAERSGRAYLLIDYPGDRRLAADANPAYCGDVFSR